MFDAPTESVMTLLGVHEGVGRKIKIKAEVGRGGGGGGGGGGAGGGGGGGGGGGEVGGLYKVFHHLYSFCLKVGGGLILRDGLILGSLR